MRYEKDIDAIRRLSENERRERESHLEKTSPTGKWPDGMVMSVNPKLVLIGISPGNSAAKEEQQVSQQAISHQSFCYPDTAGYWEKLRYLLITYFDGLRPEEAKLLTAHLNLGTVSAGQADNETLDAKYIRWASKLLATEFEPDTVIFFGYKRYIRTKAAVFIDPWNEGGGLRVRWDCPTKTECHLEGRMQKSQYFSYNAEGKNGRPIRIVLWPNHPSRPPFTRRDYWKQSVDEFCSCLKP